MKFKSFILLCYVFALVLLVSSEVETLKDEVNDAADKAPEEYHVNDGYGGGGWGDYGGGGYGGPGRGGGWGGSGGGGWGGRGGGWGGPGGGGWGGRGGGWGGRGGGSHWGCRFGCCGHWYRYYGSCSQCCRSLTEAIAFNQQKATP